MSAIVAAAQQIDRARRKAAIRNNRSEWDRWYAMGLAAGRAIVAASNAAGAGRVVAMRLADCGCVDVTYGCGTTRTDPFMPWKCDPRPCAWPRPFARGADR